VIWSGDDGCLEFYKNKRKVKAGSFEQVRIKMHKNSSEAWKKYETIYR